MNTSGLRARFAPLLHLLLLVCVLRGTLVAAPRAGLPLPENPHGLNANLACGPYCLAFLSAYFGGTADYGDILRFCSPGPQGTNLADLRQATEQLGLHARGFRLAADQLKQLEHPALLHLESSSDRPAHFVVWLGWDDRQSAAYVFSPPGRLGFEPFDAIASRFSGVALVVSADPLPEQFMIRGVPSRLLLSAWCAAALALFVLGLKFAFKTRWTGSKRRLVGPACALMISLALSGCWDAGPSNSHAGSPRSRPDERRAVDVGQVLAGVPLRHTFSIPNTTDTPFAVTRVEKSCTCQDADIKVGTVVAPGESLDVSFVVPTKGAYGRATGRLDIRTDSVEESLREISLTLSADVERPVRAIPSQLAFGRVSEHESASRTLRVESRQPGVIDKFTSARSSNPQIAVKLQERTPGALIFSVSIAPQAPRGDLDGRLLIDFDDPGFRSLSVGVRARKVGPLMLIPREVALSPFVGGDYQTFRVRVMSTADRPFRITRVVAPDHIAVSGHWDRNPAATSFDLELRVSEPPKDVREDAVIISTDTLDSVRLPVGRVPSYWRTTTAATGREDRGDGRSQTSVDHL